MKFPGHRVVGPALAMLTATALGGCGDSPLHECTLIGAQSGIVVKYDEVREAHPNQPLRIEVCIDGDCETQRGVGVPSVSAGRDIIHDSSAVEVSVTINDRARTRVFDGRTSVTPEKWQPNGSSCEPTVWFGGVEATTDGVLRQVSRSRL